MPMFANIEVLDLEENTIDDLTTFPAFPNLIELNLKNNNFDANGIDPLLPLADLSLEVLYLEDNVFTNSQIATDIGDMRAKGVEVYCDYTYCD